MTSIEKTIKLPAYSADGKAETVAVNTPQDKKLSEELAGKIAQLEEEKSKSQASLKVIGQLGDSLKQEQNKSAELLKRISELEENQTKLIESSKKLMDKQELKIGEQQSQLAEQQGMLTEQQAKVAALETLLAGQESKLAELHSGISGQESKFSAQTAKVKALVEALEKISSIATAAAQE